jgi:cellulose synthase/poly-beta-1,6-N-acetylglucosamine synthase-like glycosyltransferase
MSNPSQNVEFVSAIVPARNEEAVIAACVESLATQPEIMEILVVDDQSTDRTASLVRALMQKHAQVRLLETRELPAGWVGKNHAVWTGAQEARSEWLLFTDADAVHVKDSAAKALEIAKKQNAALVSFSPEQVVERWYEKALIPYVYCRLARHFSYEDVNDPGKQIAAANGQFLMIRRDAYNAVGGHEAIAAVVLEDVALAERAKKAGYRIWFSSGKGIVRVRMYRSFRAMWIGWKKNLYLLMSGSTREMWREMIIATGPILAVLVAATVGGILARSSFVGLAALAVGMAAVCINHAGDLKMNQYPPALAWFAIPGRLLFAGVLWVSYRSHKSGKLEWKGREYPVGTPGASKG